MFGLFFFPDNFWQDFFFLGKVYLGAISFFLGKVYLQSLTRLKNVFFFPGTKKKTVLSITDPIFAENSQKINYSLEKKMVPMNKVEKSLVAK